MASRKGSKLITGPWRSTRRSLVAFAVLLPLLASGCTDGRPSISDVLDGRTANAYRKMSIDDIADKLKVRVSVPDVSYVGNRIYTACAQGEGNWLNPPPYHLKCEAFGVVVYAWSGKFKSLQSDLLKAVSKDCRGPFGPSSSTPTHGSSVKGGTLTCTRTGTVSLVWGGVSAGDRADGLGPDCTDPSARCVAGSQPDALSRNLEKADWYLSMTISSRYFQDLP